MATPAAKPVHVPATRSSKKKRGLDPVINLDSFEDLSAMETTDKMLLGLQHIKQLLTAQADELLEANDRWLDLQKIAAQKDAHFKKQEELWKAEAEARENQVVEEAKVCATNSVVQAMYEMAKEAASLGVLHPKWDVKEWAQMLGKREIEVQVMQVDTRAGEGEGVVVGNEGDMTV